MKYVRGFYILTITFLLSVLSVSFISAACTSDQIDINTATLKELDNLTGIGPAKAQAIIDSRPFSSVDDLLKVSGIGNVTLNKIKSQGLACVGNEENSKEGGTAQKNVSKEAGINVNFYSTVLDNSSMKDIQLETINLNPQVIKSEENSPSSGKSDYSVYYLAGFVALLALLFLAKNLINRGKERNEFR